MEQNEINGKRKEIGLMRGNTENQEDVLYHQLIIPLFSAIPF